MNFFAGVRLGAGISERGQIVDVWLVGRGCGPGCMVMALERKQENSRTGLQVVGAEELLIAAAARSATERLYPRRPQSNQRGSLQPPWYLRARGSGVFQPSSGRQDLWRP
jgi:hypothetical protein